MLGKLQVSKEEKNIWVIKRLGSDFTPKEGFFLFIFFWLLVPCGGFFLLFHFMVNDMLMVITLVNGWEILG